MCSLKIFLRWLLAGWVAGVGLRAAEPAPPAPAAPSAANEVPAVFPGAQWEHADQPEKFGFARERLASLMPFLRSLDTTAMMVVAQGRVIFEYGEVEKVSYLASCRKSVLALLYGNYVAAGKIDLGRTLRQLQFDDVGGLLPAELDATIDDLLTSRSGIFHPAAYLGDAAASAPPRGSQKAGRYFLYNNWDFNAAGAVFEQLTGKGIYEALQQELALPLGFEDFDLARQKKAGDPKRSSYLGYPMDLSTRDMARIGYLAACHGNWRGQQVVPADWIKRITALVTPVEGINPPFWRGDAEGSRWGYGRLWWVWDDRNLEGPFAGAYTGWGVSGQFITVLPALNVVVVHKTVPGKAEDGHTRNVTVLQYQAILMHLVAAHRVGALDTRK